MVATIELEKHEKAFDTETDEIFVKRFNPVNKLLKIISHEDVVHSDANLPLMRNNESRVDSFASKVDNFKSYKEKLFGKVSLKQMDWIQDSKKML